MDSFGNDMLSNLLSSVNTTESEQTTLDYSGKSVSLNTADDAKELISLIEQWADAKMQTLELRGNTLGVDAAKALGSALASRPELKRALWSDLFTGRMKTEIPEALNSLGQGMMAAQAQLTVLDLSDNAFGPIGVGGLADLLKSPVCTFLQELRLNNNGIGITGAKLLVEALKPMPVHLTVLEMGRNRLENVGAQAISTIIRNLTKLRVLKMPQNGIYISGVTALCSALENCPQLQTLDLNDNTVGPKGAIALGAIFHKLERLEELNLGDCLLKTKGAISLMDAMKGKLSSIKDLNLSFDEIGSRAVPHILRELEARQTLSIKLAGNTLGTNGKALLSAFGDRVELRAPDEEEVSEDDDEEEQGSEESDGDDEENGKDSGASSGVEDNEATEEGDASLLDVSSLNISSPTPVSRFLSNPSRTNLAELGEDPVKTVQDHIDELGDELAKVQAGVHCCLGLCGLREKQSASRLLHQLSQWAEAGNTNRRWLLSNTVLTSFGLIKAEKKMLPKWDWDNCLGTFSEMTTEVWFPKDVLDILRFFVKLRAEQPLKESAVDFSKYPRFNYDHA